MDFSEFVGFIISLLAMLFLFLNNSREKRRQAKDPVAYEEEQNKRNAKLEEFLKSLEDGANMAQKKTEKIKAYPTSVSRAKSKGKPFKANLSSYQEYTSPSIEQRRLESAIEQRRLDSSLETHQFESNIEKRQFRTSFENEVDPYRVQKSEAYSIKSYSQTARVQDLVKYKYSPKDLILIKEIMGPPKGLQE